MTMFLRTTVLFAFLFAASLGNAQSEVPAQPQLGSEASPVVVAPSPVTPVVIAPVPAAPVASDQRFGGKDGVFRMVVIGDTLARGLGAGLERLTELDPRFEVISRINEASGIARPEVYDWPNAIPKILKSSSFDAVVVFMGANDRQPIKLGDTKLEFGTPEWTQAYRQKIDNLIRVISSHQAKVYWINLPPMGNPLFESEMRIIANLHRELVVNANGQFLDLNADLSNPDGSYMASEIDEKGNTRRLRNKDGINFSRGGNNLLGELVMSSVRVREGAGELAAARGEDAPQAQVAMAIPEPMISAKSPIFGQVGPDDATQTFEAQVISDTPVQDIAPDNSTLGKLGLKIARNSLAQRFFRSGEVRGAPIGRFDDYAVPQVPAQ